MTNEEAAAMLERMKNYFLPTSPMLEERREITALDLAISALSKQSASCEQADHIAEPDKMVKLKKRTITERLIIAESLINSVIADSDQFREATKKTEDIPDTNVEKIPYKKPEIICDPDCDGFVCSQNGIYGWCPKAERWGCEYFYELERRNNEID